MKLPTVIRRNLPGTLFMFWFILILLPRPVFDLPSSPVLFDRSGHLLGAKIASNGQWHFSRTDSLSNKFKLAITQFEDRNFYEHIGVDPKGLLRAFYHNIKGDKRQGGSTLSMQIARMSRDKKRRNYSQKIIEILFALRLEVRYTKEEILKIYASNAPFGGNIIGIEAASWRYFSKSHHELSWAETAMLAVLPNAPGLIHPGRSRKALKGKRDRLLKRLNECGYLSKDDLNLSMLEPLPLSPKALPSEAPHLLDMLLKNRDTKSYFHSTIDLSLQKELNRISKEYMAYLQARDINNLGLIVTDTYEDEVIAYIGNTPGLAGRHQPYVDLIQAKRSSGSILKPLLFAKALDGALISPTALLKDLPNSWGSYSPKNYSKQFEGLVPANESLYRSLNLPFVQLLEIYNHEKFLIELRKMGFNSLTRSADNYGLSLILGGGEVSLWDLNTVYGGMCKTLNGFEANEDSYAPSYYSAPRLLQDSKKRRRTKKRIHEHFSAASIWQTFESLTELKRPGTGGDWDYFSSAQRVAWKTGTSHGFKDAWTVGTNGRYLVGVWVGNADGEGRDDLVGIKAAAPLFFKVMDMLPRASWFNSPEAELFDQNICAISGYKATDKCPLKNTVLNQKGEELAFCKYHEWFSCTSDSIYRANKNCLPGTNLQKISFFVPSPRERYFMNQSGRAFEELPPLHPECGTLDTEISRVEFIYPPRNNFKIYIPKRLNRERSKIVFTAAHSLKSEVLYWHLDQEYMGQTKDFHEMPFSCSAGRHVMLVKDSKGAEKRVVFEVLEKK